MAHWFHRNPIKASAPVTFESIRHVAANSSSSKMLSWVELSYFFCCDLYKLTIDWNISLLCLIPWDVFNKNTSERLFSQALMSRKLKKFVIWQVFENMLDQASMKKKKTVEKDEYIFSLKRIFMGHFIDLILHYKKSLTKLLFKWI